MNGMRVLMVAAFVGWTSACATSVGVTISGGLHGGVGVEGHAFVREAFGSPFGVRAGASVGAASRIAGVPAVLGGVAPEGQAGVTVGGSVDLMYTRHSGVSGHFFDAYGGPRVLFYFGAGRDEGPTLRVHSGIGGGVVSTSSLGGPWNVTLDAGVDVFPSWWNASTAGASTSVAVGRAKLGLQLSF